MPAPVFAVGDTKVTASRVILVGSSKFLVILKAEVAYDALVAIRTGASKSLSG